jgi:4-alpha-glucanotransferase
MTDAPLRSLRELARLHGVLPAYLDVAKQRREASAASLLGVLQALGVPVSNPADAGEALRQGRRDRWRQAIEPVHTAWNGRLSRLALRLPEDRARGWGRLRLRLESGEVLEPALRLDRLKVIQRARVQGREYLVGEAPVSLRLPTGYHRLELEVGSQVWRALLLSAPEKTYSERKEIRTWGLFAPLYSLHGERNWGGGDYGSLGELIEWTASLGGGAVSTLPLLPAFLARPCEPSPYSPVSRLFWNEFYLDVAQAPELAHCPQARALMESASFQRRRWELRRTELVDYQKEMCLKRLVLEKLAQSFFRGKTGRHQAFLEYLRAQPLAEDYARFRAVCESRAGMWPDWPLRLREGKLRPGDYSERTKQFYLYAQWLAHEQMSGVSRRSRELGVRLYLDMPLGVHPGGYDAWRERASFALEATGGAPPDSVFTKGQNWGFAPLHPGRIRERGHDYLIACLRHDLRHSGMLRFDHVMALHRLYWVPKGLSAHEGAYVRYPFQELYALLSIESHRHRALVVGENLGTVPQEVNAALDQHSVRGMYVVQYEQRPDPGRALRPVPRRVVASLNTHDMPPFHAFWAGQDIDDRRALGLLKPSRVGLEKRERRRLNAALGRFLQRRGLLAHKGAGVGALLEACLFFLAGSPAEFVLVNLEDLWLETRPQNVPGTSGERLNWRRKLQFSLEELRSWPGGLRLLNSLHQIRTGKGIPRHE